MKRELKDSVKDLLTLPAADLRTLQRYYGSNDVKVIAKKILQEYYTTTKRSNLQPGINRNMNGFTANQIKERLGVDTLVGADLSGALLNDAELDRVDLRRASLFHAQINHARLVGAQLEGALLTDAYLDGTLLQNANLRGADLTGADLASADLTGADLTGADLTGADLTGAIGVDLTGAIIDRTVNTNRNMRGFTSAQIRERLGVDTLVGADLSGANLRRANLRGANLNDADLRNARLDNAILSEAYFERAKLNHANLTNAQLDSAILDDADLSGAKLRDANLESAELNRTILRDADLSYANLRNTVFTDCDLTGANFTGANISGTYFTNSDTTGAIFQENSEAEAEAEEEISVEQEQELSYDRNMQRFTEAQIKRRLGVDTLAGADLRGVDLTGARLSYAHLNRVKLTGANLTGANLTGAELRAAELQNAIMVNADLTGAQLPIADLSGADLDLAILLGANLTGAFLRNTKLTNADLREVDFFGAILSRTDFRGSDLTDAIFNQDEEEAADNVVEDDEDDEDDSNEEDEAAPESESSSELASEDEGDYPSHLNMRGFTAAQIMERLGVDTLEGADLRDAYLRDAYLRGANLTSANLNFADLKGVNLSFANLSGANLKDANLRGANLRGANLTSADLSFAVLTSADLTDAIMENVIGLQNQNQANRIDELIKIYDTQRKAFDALRKREINRDEYRQLRAALPEDQPQKPVTEEITIQPLPNEFEKCSNQIDPVTQETWSELYAKGAVKDPVMLLVYNEANEITRRDCAERGYLTRFSSDLQRKTGLGIIYPIQSGDTNWYVLRTSLALLKQRPLQVVYALKPIGSRDFTFVGSNEVLEKTMVYEINRLEPANIIHNKNEITLERIKNLSQQEVLDIEPDKMYGIYLYMSNIGKWVFAKGSFEYVYGVYDTCTKILDDNKKGVIIVLYENEKPIRFVPSIRVTDDFAPRIGIGRYNSSQGFTLILKDLIVVDPSITKEPLDDEDEDEYEYDDEGDEVHNYFLAYIEASSKSDPDALTFDMHVAEYNGLIEKYGKDVLKKALDELGLVTKIASYYDGRISSLRFHHIGDKTMFQLWNELQTAHKSN